MATTAMKGLTLFQPWATLVAIGAKSIETRSWYTNYRGALLITASKKFTQEDRALCRREPFASALINAGFKSDDDLPLGMALAATTLVNVLPTDEIVRVWETRGWTEHTQREMAFGNYAPERFALVLNGVRALKTPRPAEHLDRHGRAKAGGAQGLFTVPLSLVRACA